MTTVFGLPIGEILVLLGPVILYAIFTIYRTAFNRQVRLHASLQMYMAPALLLCTSSTYDCFGR